MKLAFGNLKAWLAKNAVQLVIFIFTITSVLILPSLDKSEMVPATLFTGLAALFSYQALSYSREKFRLELFEKRLEFYTSMVNLCSMVTQGYVEHEDDRREEVETARYECIRGHGSHKAHLLFGDDIVQKVKELDQAFTTLSMAHTARRSAAHFDPQEEARAFTLFQETVSNLPVLFRPYIYFGEYQQAQ
jgi:hypothetical protein